MLPDAFWTTPGHIQQVAAFCTAVGMIAGAATVLILQRLRTWLQQKAPAEESGPADEASDASDE